MTKFLLSMIGVVGLLSNLGYAGDPTNDLTPKEAVRLIAMKSNVPANTIEISFIVDGSSKCAEGFEIKHVRRVAAIHPVTAKGSQTRRLVFYYLYWNEALGWFMWESRPERAGDAVYIWSELRGAIVNH